ncbi:MAG: FGGY family carbohydrate kinase [Ginsengibacter sp.]
MNRIPVIAVYDIGKTNKKLLLFDERYKLIREESKHLEEIKDEDDFPCEDVNALTHFIQASFNELLRDKRYEIKAVNFTAYGASFVYLDEHINVRLPLYNYLKPYPAALKEKFYNDFGGVNEFTQVTASPVLGSLNSGMQLYRIKYEKPDVFEKIKYALHLPQYVSFVLTGNLASDITSIGCHTNLWDFQKNQYHAWVEKEGVLNKLPPIANLENIAAKEIDGAISAGIGLHDSSAALIPYLLSFSEPFVLISTGTWCITLNPFNDEHLTQGELRQDCLSYLSYKGTPVKASRLFAGYEHEQQIKKLSEHFGKELDYYKTVQYDSRIAGAIVPDEKAVSLDVNDATIKSSAFGLRDLKTFASYEEAYHHLIADIIVQQLQSTNLVLKGTKCKRIFVDGGFSGNPVYMNMLAHAFPRMEVFAASLPHASALGAALVIHEHWNSQPLPPDIIELKYYSAPGSTMVGAALPENN